MSSRPGVFHSIDIKASWPTTSAPSGQEFFDKDDLCRLKLGKCKDEKWEKVVDAALLNFKSHVFLVEVQLKKASLSFLDVC